ncbi:FAD-dependent oxidoreductase (plasmid) [Comamonadaceae bacterium OTU4NAUVB1]|nr:FAD-dependent oxidoreductase [Comamonadaceae bacterium OTU4NAUVB1]
MSRTSLLRTAAVPPPSVETVPETARGHHDVLAPTVVVGGGAAGLELVTRLTRQARRGGGAPAPVVLVDRVLDHVWKPRLHEIATAMQSRAAAASSFLGHASAHGYRYEIGALEQVDPVGRTVTLGPVVGPQGQDVLPARTIPYGRLVLALGSEENDFGTPGARAHCHFLNDPEQATRIRDALLVGAFRVARGQQAGLSVVVVGGGATGVELCAEIHHAIDALRVHEPALDDTRIRLVVVEGADRLLSSNPPEVSAHAARALERRNVEIVLGDRVASIDAHGVLLRSGRRIDADLRIWTAGIRGPRVFERIPVLPITRSGRVRVDGRLRCVGLPDVHAIGDCAEWVDPATGHPAPYTAQVASAQARYLAEALRAGPGGADAPDFHFESAGAIVSLGDRAAAGNLTTRFGRRSHDRIVQGLSAKLVYAALYRQHELAIHGWRGALRRLLGDWLGRTRQPDLKLH